MSANGVVNNTGTLDFGAIEYLITTVTKENETPALSRKNTLVSANSPLLLTAEEFLTTTAISPKKLSGNDSRDVYQYYLIGVYSFFVFLFAIGLIMILCRKLQKACCSSRKKPQCTTESQEDLNPQDSPVFEHHVNMVNASEGIHQGHDSDYDNFSDSSNDERDGIKDNPPAYEYPPPYSVVLPE